jgi:hypothetical protein
MNNNLFLNKNNNKNILFKFYLMNFNLLTKKIRIAFLVFFSIKIKYDSFKKNLK